MSRLDGKSAFFTTRLKTFNRSTQLFKITFRDQYAVSNVTNLPGVFKYIALAELSPAETVVTAANKQEEVKQEDKKLSQAPEKQVAETRQPPVKPAEKPAAKPVPVQTKPAAGQTSTSTDAIVYRVQFSSNTKPKGSYEITAGGKKYKTFEYLYNGAYRSCAGEFSTSSSAAVLQRQMKQEGYPDAFVVAFKNGVRSTDPALFKK